MTRDSDTHPAGGDAQQAPFMGSAGRQASPAPGPEATMPVTVEQAAQAVIDNWDSNTLDREKFCEGEYGSYWSPHAAMVNSEQIAALRAALNTRATLPSPAGLAGELKALPELTSGMIGNFTPDLRNRILTALTANGSQPDRVVARPLSDQPDSTDEGLAELLRECREWLSSIGLPGLTDDLLDRIDARLSTGTQP